MAKMVASTPIKTGPRTYAQPGDPVDLGKESMAALERNGSICSAADWKKRQQSGGGDDQGAEIQDLRDQLEAAESANKALAAQVEELSAQLAEATKDDEATGDLGV